MKYSKEIIEILCKHLQKGSSIKSACAAARISKETFYEWKRSKSDFSDRMDAAMAIPDKKVENALYKSAIGSYRYTEKHFEQIRDAKGKMTELKLVRTIRKRVVPAVCAQKFILINRNPDEWKDKKEENVIIRGSLSIEDMRKSLEDAKSDGSG